MKIAVIGAGAAGLLCSGELAKRGFDVTLFEKREKIGRKIVVTGKGRCNITNFCDEDEFFSNVPQNSRFLYSAIKAFPPKETVEFFNDLGLKTKVERGNRVFPVSDKSLDVVDTLGYFCKDYGVKLHLSEPVLDILSDEEGIKGLKTTKKTYKFDKVIVATGGLSYPLTGSTGDGYKFAEKFSHSIVKPVPSLCALESNMSDVKELMGLSLKNVELTLFEGTKPIFKDFGEMIFTHFGVSGPMVLSASSHMKEDKQYKVTIDLKPALSREELDKRLLKDFEKYQNKDFLNSLSDLLPKKIIPNVIARSGILEHTKVHSITKKERQKLGFVLKNFEVEISKKRHIDEAIITRGGVNVKEINPKTLESKKIKDLYFIGEVLDIDAYTGGFNLQIAWSTAFLLAKSLEE